MRPGFDLGQTDHPPTLTACNFAASGPTETHSTSLERSQPPSQTQLPLGGLKGFLIQSVFCESDLIYIGLMLWAGVSFFWLAVLTTPRPC